MHYSIGIYKEPTKIEISNEEEILSSNEISSNELSSNTVSNNEVSSNTVSENKIVENIEIKELSPLIEPILEIKSNYFSRLTEDEKIIYQLGYSSFLDSEKPENGIYETNFDISLYGEEYSKYKDYKNGDKDFNLLYNS